MAYSGTQHHALPQHTIGWTQSQMGLENWLMQSTS